MSSVRSVLGALWRGLDGLRRFLHLLLLLVLFGLLIGALRGSIPSVPDRAALVIAPEGQLVEQLSGDPLERAVAEARGENRPETLVWDLIDAIRAAANDRRIRVVALDLDNLSGTGGQPTLEELARAIREFRKSGKKVIAYGTSFLRDQYYLAAQADEIYLDPLGFVLIDGYGRWRMFFKDALDKLDVDVNVFRVGAYKSAVETYTRNNMSPQDREESLAYLNALWSNYQTAVGKSRGMKPDAISAYVDTLPQTTTAAKGATAQVALAAHLVTGLKSKLEVEQRLSEITGQDDTSGSFRQVSHQDYVRVVHAQNTLGRRDRTRIGVIVAEGEILDGNQSPGTVGGESTSHLIRQARLDDKIRAVVLRVDSPGGSVMASEQIYRELRALQAAGKPLVVSMSNLAASGGYYISAPASEIWASPATITGSIGIFAVIPTASRTLSKVGVSVDGVGTTPLSGQLRLDRPMNDEARTLLQSTVEHGYDEFLARVSAGRHKTREQVDAVAQGRVWAGEDAIRYGLVDHLGSFDDAVKAAARRAKLTDYKIDFIEPELSWAQTLALQVKAWAVRTVLAGDRDARLGAQLALRLDPLRQEVERLSRFSLPNRLYAYCFCTAQ
ncbi:MAG TPA: signal peptide peptidase SppA [Steroidobacteraceae bacterium]|jgi:protease IV|nr:signal peptide peptidase SppA [Steroidobacteraceae bacterium]